MADVKKTLPPSVGESLGISDILDSCDSELDRLEQAARAACHRLAAGTADQAGAELWERELGLDVREDLSLEARRTLIRIALEQMDTCTPKRLLELLGRMVEGKAALQERFDAYTVSLAIQATRFLVPSLRQVEKALRRALPAHLALQLSATAGLNNADTPKRALLSGVKLEIYTEEETT